MVERRRSARQKSLLGGFVHFDNSPSALDCLIRDMSEGGTRLKFAHPPMGPDILNLHIPTKNQTLRVKVEWRATDEIGVSFLSPANTATSDGGNLAERVDRLEAEVGVLKQLIKRMQKNAAQETDVA